MDKERSVAKTIDEYISRFPPETRAALKRLRSVIRQSAPGAEERISYEIPAFRLQGNLVYFAAYARHIGFYPTSSGIRAFRRELSPYKTGKGTVQFPIGEPLPFDLIGRIVKFRVAENLRRAAKARPKDERPRSRR